MSEPIARPGFRKWPLAIVAVVALAIIGVGLWFHVAQNASVRRSAEDELVSIAELKAAQIQGWRNERLGDAAAIADNRLIADELSAWVENRDPLKTQGVLAWLESYRKNYGYDDALLVDPQGTVLLDADGGNGSLIDAGLENLAKAFVEHRAVLTDLHKAADRETIHLGAIAPLFTESGGQRGEPLAAVVLVSDAASFLFPLVQEWPTPSGSAETLLVEREGDHVLFLNELRHRQGTALIYTEPLANVDLPAVRAVQGEQGVFYGRDYREVEVIAALEPIPGSPWFMIAKVDASEALAAAGVRSGATLVLIVILVLALFVGVWANWQLRQKRHYREAFEAEAEGRMLAARFEHLVKHANDAILMGTLDGTIVEANEKAIALYGYPREELIGLNFIDTVPPEGWVDYEERRRTILHEGSIVRETVHMQKDGTRIPVEVSSALVDEGGSPHLQAIVRDIADRKKVEEERLEFERRLQQSQRLESLGVMAGGIAHDFNNILMAVLGHADLALSDLPASSPGRENLKEIVQASRKAAELCRQMLAYSGHGQSELTPLDLGTLVSDMVQLLRTAIPKKILFNLNLEKNLPRVEGDTGQLTQVVMNLVINAAEAIGERSGVITVSTGAMECTEEYLADTYLDERLAPGLYVTLEVSDTGRGMDAKTRGSLFEPFFTTKFTGRGLGLSAVLGIVRAHRGAIKVYSEVDRGTTFKLALPALGNDGATGSASAVKPGEQWQGSGTVLLVDDEETVRALGKRMLERIGFEVLTAIDGREALEVFRTHRGEIVLVLLDLTMPRMNGEEAFRELRRIDPAARVVMSSGYSENDISARLAGKGLVGFIQKPYTVDVLRGRLAAVLGRPPSDSLGPPPEG